MNLSVLKSSLQLRGRRILVSTSSNKNYHHVTAERGIKSLAFTTYFMQPELGMTQYEDLSRGTAFLLAVDPPDFAAKGPYGHLQASEMERQLRDFQRKKNFTPPLAKGNVKDMGWLEFMPREYRPNVHVLTTSHVVSPFLWLDYYPHDWLTQVRQEHCKYKLEVYDSDNPTKEPLASFELHNTPIHHPEGRDVVFLHLQDEEKALKEMAQLGVQILYSRNPEKKFQKGETIDFDGFVVRDPNHNDEQQQGQEQPPVQATEDTREFQPYHETGTLAFHTNDRFFATTPKPLPEGLCGAPALDADGELCGIVEGIVPIDHENQNIAGSAAFMPSFVLAAFTEYVERAMLEQMMPKDLFQHVVRAKETNSIGGGSFQVDKDGKMQAERSWDEVYEEQVDTLKKKLSKEEVDAVLWNVKRERDEVIKIFNEEGGDLDEIIARVREQTLALREQAIEQHKKKGGVQSGD